MIKTALRLAIVAASFAAAQAHAVVVSFTGVVTGNYEQNATAPAVGETITGFYTFDATGPVTESYGDGSSYTLQYFYDLANTNSLSINGVAKFSGGTVLTVNGANGGGDAGQFVYRNYAGVLNQFGNYVETYTAGDQSSNSLQVYAYDYNGAASGLFTNPAGGLSFSQGVDLAADGAYFGGSFSGATANGYYYGYFTATSLTISPVPESSNLALLLGGLGLVGFAARRRQQALRA